MSRLIHILLLPATTPQQQETDNDTATLKELEKERLQKVLKETGRNITKSAEILGVSRRTLYNKIEKYGL